jgi:hypothetical protein
MTAWWFQPLLPGAATLADAGGETTTTNTLTASLDGLLFKSGESAATSLDALLFKSGITSTTSLDGLIFKSGASATTSFDGVLIESANTVTTTLSLDAELLTTFSAGTSLDGLLFKSGVTKTTSLDGVLALESTTTNTLVVSLDANIQAQATGLTTYVVMDAYLFSWKPKPTPSTLFWNPAEELPL